MELTLKEPQTENFHEWRKQVNYLRHQLQILQEIKIRFVKVTLQDVRKLAQTLGLMNDLAVLWFNLYPLKSGQGEIELQRLEQLILSYQKVYKTEAIKLGKALYHLPSKLFTT